MPTETRAVRYVITGDAASGIHAMKATEAAATTAGERLEHAGTRLRSLGSGMEGFGRKMTSLSLPLIAVGGYAIKSAMDFQTSMTLLRTQAGASAKEVGYLEKGVLKLGPKVAEGPKELAEALYPIRSVGLQGAQAMKALEAASKGSQVSGAGLTETADAMAGALRTQTKDVRSASGAMSIMNGIVGLGKMHLSDLTAALGTGILSPAKAAGLGLRDVGAAIDAMTRQGVPAQTEATRLQLTLTKFKAPTGTALTALRQIGLGQFSLADDLRKPHGLVVALRDLHEHLGRLSVDQQNLDISKIFGGARGSTNVVGLLNALPEMEKIRGQLGKYGEKQLSSAFATRQADASYKMAQALAAGKTALVQLGQTLIPIIMPALEKFAHWIEVGIGWLTKMPKPLKDVAVAFAIFLAAGGPLLIFLGKLTSTLGSAIGLVGKLATVLPGLGAAEGTAAAETGAGGLAGAMTALGAAIPLVALGAFIVALNKIKTPSWLGGTGHTLWHDALQGSAYGLIHPDTVAGGGLNKAQRIKLLRRQMQPGVLAPSLERPLEVELAKLEGKPTGATPTKPAAAGALAQMLGFGPITVKVDLDGREVARNTVSYIRNTPAFGKVAAEGITKVAQKKAVH